MQTLVRLLVRRSWALGVVIVVAILASIATWHSVRVENDDNLLAFLPEDNPDVRAFYDINTRFGGTDVALVGIEVDDPFDPAFLHKLTGVTKSLKDAGGLSYVLTLTNVVDFAVDEVSGGIITSALVDGAPATPEGKAALREKVLSRDHVVGNLIANDGKAVLLYCFLAYGTEPRAMSEKIRGIVTTAFPDNKIDWGGNPFISTYVYDTVQKDLRRLSPWAVLVIVLLIFVSLRSAVATLLVLLSTGTAISITVGLMQASGVKLNLMLGSMPIVLFAIGCTYSIHVLSRYFEWRAKHDATTAIAKTLNGIGPVVLVAGATAAAAIASFVVMDIEPIRTFGTFTAIGILTSVILAVTFVPAALVLTAPGERLGAHGQRARRFFVRLAVFYESHRLAMGASILAVALFFGFFVTRVHTGVDQRSFFKEGSPPDQADQFLRQHFGAAQFVQLMVAGDMTSPAVLREVASLADRIELLPHVTSVQHVGMAVATINQAMSGQRRIPDTAGQVGNLYTFLAGDPSVGQLVTPDHEQALLQIKVDSSDREAVGALLEMVTSLLDSEALSSYVVSDSAGDESARARREATLLWRLERLAKRYDAPLPATTAQVLHDFLAKDAVRADVAAVTERIRRFLRSSECAVPLPEAQGTHDPAAAVAHAVVALGERPLDAALSGAIATALALPPTDAGVDDLALSISTPVGEAWTIERATSRARALIAALDAAPRDVQAAERFEAQLTMGLVESDQVAVLLPAAADAATGHLAMQLNGLPVLYRGLAKSVQKNQLKSLGCAVALVFLILSMMLGSFKSGLVASAPTLFTLIIIHGAMGLFHINLDVGTSLLGSLIIANGIDYAVHMLAAWETPEGGTLARAAACAADRAGPAIWASAATMFVGFVVLSLGEARVLQNVTGLKALAMLVGALSTFAIVPVLARRRRYQVFRETCDAIEPSQVVDDVLLEHGPAEQGVRQ